MKRKLWMAIPLLITPLLAFVPSCAYTAPYRRVEAISNQTKTAVVTISAVESRPGQRSAFFADTKRVLADLPNQSGLLGYSFRFQIIGRKAWTMTAWKDEASRDRFAASPIHRAAVKNSRVTAQNMRFVSIEVPVSKLPMKWPEALRLLETATAYE
ncbi:MAG: hypothetical protein ACRCXD_03795 [Luteolibacter sp.]